MSEKVPDISLNYTDPVINDTLKEVQTSSLRGVKHYTHNEDFFLLLNEYYQVPSFPIHHDVAQKIPSKTYLETLRSIIKELVDLEPAIFQGLTYFFDPTDILRPCFFQLYRQGTKLFLYLLKIDLHYHPGFGELLTREENDKTSVYLTNKLFLDAYIIPLKTVHKTGNKVSGFDIIKLIKDTWIGETGGGYFVQGIWIDNELTKFFSKLVIPSPVKFYPYYPFQCIYQTIALSLVHPTPDRRRQLLPYLSHLIEYLEPHMELIQKSMKSKGFNNDNPVLYKLKKALPEYWNNLYRSLKVKIYLNENSQREFLIDEGLESTE
ncbi:hypothetical protein [Spirochaeta cellobiosiphila]|uniref:hypothetical protein n=1 Tax=Spirochaeta cellobiosiphila TaxID=504483 RepID=UPI00041C8F37|nr:hypothetical protein [Spirochaeta cellobiosiphila]